MAGSLVKVADEGSVDWESTVATAQVHATLALAAATAALLAGDAITRSKAWIEVTR